MTDFICKPPVGNSADRDNCIIWPAGWKNTNKFLRNYTLDDGTKMGHHTGVDLLRKDGSTRGQPVFAIGAGKIVHKGPLPGKTWGNVVVIYHGIVDGKPLFSRYAHLLKIVDREDPIVDVDTKIGTVGSGPPGSGMVAHLHFDISNSAVLFSNRPKEGPDHWPFKRRSVEANYVNPEDWFDLSHTITKDAKGLPTGSRQPTFAFDRRIVIHPKGVQVRKSPSLSAELIQDLKQGTKLALLRAGAGNAHGFTWAQIGEGEMKGFWVTICTSEEPKEFFLGLDK